MAKLNLSNKEIDVWNNAEDCDCGGHQCEENHKLCSICKETVMYGAHESVQPGSAYTWNIDHIIPKAAGGSNHINNLQVTCVQCNRNKGDRF